MVDDSEAELHEKFEMWEQRGVPLRVEIGPEELKTATLTVFRRDTNERCTVPADVDALEDRLEEVSFNTPRSDPGSVPVDKTEAVFETVSSGSVAEFGYCGAEACGREIESGINGEILGMDLFIDEQTECLICGDDTRDVAYASRRY